MSRADDRRQAQLAIETDRIVNQRPSEAPRPRLDPDDPRGPHYWPCPARLGQTHDISMKRFGGGFACWTCGKTKQELLDERPAVRVFGAPRSTP